MYSHIDIFMPLIGRTAWQVKRGIGSFLTLEFGWPHLNIRQPRTSESDSNIVNAHFRRRRVTVTGDWHFWIQNCHWEVVTVAGSANHNDCAADIDMQLIELDGQILCAIDKVASTNEIILAFDLNAFIKLRPTSELPDENQWGLYEFEGRIITCTNAGDVSAS